MYYKQNNNDDGNIRRKKRLKKIKKTANGWQRKRNWFCGLLNGCNRWACRCCLLRRCCWCCWYCCRCCCRCCRCFFYGTTCGFVLHLLVLIWLLKRTRSVHSSVHQQHFTRFYSAHNRQCSPISSTLKWTEKRRSAWRQFWYWICVLRCFVEVENKTLGYGQVCFVCGFIAAEHFLFGCFVE